MMCFEHVTIHYSGGCIGIISWHTSTTRTAVCFVCAKMEKELEKWTSALDKLSGKKTEYLRPGNCQLEISMLEERLPTYILSKYLVLDFTS